MHVSRVKKKPSSLRHLLVCYSRTFTNVKKQKSKAKTKTKTKNKNEKQKQKKQSKTPFMFTNNGQVLHLHEFNYRLVTVTQISSDGEVTKRWTGLTCCPSTRWNLNRFTSTDRKTNPSAIDNRQPGHLRFPAKPNG